MLLSLLLSRDQGAPLAGHLPKAFGGENSAHHPAILYIGSMALVASGLVGLVCLYVDRGLRKRF